MKDSTVNKRVVEKTIKKSSGELGIVGWRERVELPDFKIKSIKAKVDTGARTSSIHAYNLKVISKKGVEFASFYIYPDQNSSEGKKKCLKEIIEYRKIKSSNGASELRPVILTNIILGSKKWEIELTLTNRDEMGFRMLIGRSSIKRKFLVNPGKSFIANKEKR